MAASINLTTLENIKSYLSLDNDTDDQFLETLIAAVSEAIENYCGREFANKTRIEFYDGCGAKSVVLNCRPVHHVMFVHDDEKRMFSDDSIVHARDYTVHKDEGFISLRTGCFSNGLKNVRVEYEAGYRDLPAAVVQAATVLVAHFYARSKAGANSISSESPGVHTVSYYTGEWPHQARGLLAEFRELGI